MCSMGEGGGGVSARFLIRPWSPLGVRVGVGEKVVRMNGRRPGPQSWPAATAQVLRLTPVHRTGGPHPVAPTPEKPHHDWRVVACGLSLTCHIVTSSGRSIELSLDWRSRRRQAVETKGKELFSKRVHGAGEQGTQSRLNGREMFHCSVKVGKEL